MRLIKQVITGQASCLKLQGTAAKDAAHHAGNLISTIMSLKLQATAAKDAAHHAANAASNAKTAIANSQVAHHGKLFINHT